MKSLLLRVCLGLLFLLAYRFYASISADRPIGEWWEMLYFAGAATVDWIMYRITPRFVSGKLCRDIEALCIASIIVHAIGFACYMTWTPSYIHNWTIKGINYVLAFLFIFTGHGDAFNDINWRGLVRSFAVGRLGHQAKEAQR